MTFDLLPQDEPGNPLLDTPPGFTDALMQRIADYERQQRLRRRLAILLMAVFLMAAVAVIYMLRTRRADDERKQGAVQTQPVVAAAPVRQAALHRAR